MRVAVTVLLLFCFLLSVISQLDNDGVSSPSSMEAKRERQKRLREIERRREQWWVRHPASLPYNSSTAEECTAHLWREALVHPSFSRSVYLIDEDLLVQSVTQWSDGLLGRTEDSEGIDASTEEGMKTVLEKKLDKLETESLAIERINRVSREGQAKLVFVRVDDGSDLDSAESVLFESPLALTVSVVSAKRSVHLGHTLDYLRRGVQRKSATYLYDHELSEGVGHDREDEKKFHESKFSHLKKNEVELSLLLLDISARIAMESDFRLSKEDTENFMSDVSEHVTWDHYSWETIRCVGSVHRRLKSRGSEWAIYRSIEEKIVRHDEEAKRERERKLLGRSKMSDRPVWEKDHVGKSSLIEFALLPAIEKEEHMKDILKKRHSFHIKHFRGGGSDDEVDEKHGMWSRGSLFWKQQRLAIEEEILSDGGTEALREVQMWWEKVVDEHRVLLKIANEGPLHNLLRPHQAFDIDAYVWARCIVEEEAIAMSLLSFGGLDRKEGRRQVPAGGHKNERGDQWLETIEPALLAPLAALEGRRIFALSPHEGTVTVKTSKAAETEEDHNSAEMNFFRLNLHTKGTYDEAVARVSVKGAVVQSLSTSVSLPPAWNGDNSSANYVDERNETQWVSALSGPSVPANGLNSLLFRSTPFMTEPLATKTDLNTLDFSYPCLPFSLSTLQLSRALSSFRLQLQHDPSIASLTGEKLLLRIEAFSAMEKLSSGLFTCIPREELSDVASSLLVERLSHALSTEGSDKSESWKRGKMFLLQLVREVLIEQGEKKHLPPNFAAEEPSEILSAKGRPKSPVGYVPIELRKRVLSSALRAIEMQLQVALSSSNVQLEDAPQRGHDGEL